MKKTLQPLWLLFILTAFMTSCRGASAGPSIWIDQPLDPHTQFGLDPVVITVHASDSDGVESFDLYLNGELVQTLSAGGKRLAEASWQWQPTETGQYILKAAALDSNGNLGASSEVMVNITGPATPDLEQILQASFDQITCLDGQTIAAEISIKSPLGIESFSIFNTVIQAEYSESFQPPLPLEIHDTYQITEPLPDPIDRDHQWGLRVSLPGQEDSFTYLYEPDGRCPGHYQAVADLEVPELIDLDQVQAKQNTACRQGPDLAFDISGYLLQDEYATALGKLANSSWLQVEMPETGYICWIAANLLDYDPTLLESLPDVVPPPLPATPEPEPTATTAPDTTAPQISGLSSSPDQILTQSGGCPAYSRTTTIQASISDDTSVSQAIASWNIGGESGQVTLTHAGGSTYQGVIGPVSTTGTLSITIQAKDGAGNTNTASAPSVTVQNCIE